MLDLNLSVKVLKPRAPYLFVWWNDADGCADGLMVTCECQGYLRQQNVDIKAPDWHVNLVKAMQQAEIATVHPQRNGTSLCKLSDVVAVKKDTSKESKGKRKKKKKGQKKKKEKTKTSEPEGGEDGSHEKGREEEIAEARKDEEETKEAEEDHQHKDFKEELTDGNLEGRCDSQDVVTAADDYCGEVDEEGVGNGGVDEERVDGGEADEQRVAVEPADKNDEASVVPISISSMSETICDMLSPLEEAARELLPAETILSSLPAVPEPQDSMPESNMVAELKVLKDKKFLEGYNRKLQNRKITVILCEICGAATSNKSFKKHMDAVHMNGQMEGFHKCSICPKEFAYPANLRRHELIHYNTRFHCSVCGKSFSQSGSCKIHERKVHGCRKTVTTVTKSDTVTKLTTWPHYKLATRSSGIAQCKICDKIVKRTSMKCHMETHNPQGVSCPICHKRYSSNNSLRIHSVIHKERKFQCSVCGKRFHHSFGLVIHMRIHNNDKPLPCRYCDEKFSRYQARINHERRHTGEKPYSCFICVKNWRDRTTYLQHMRRHHPNEPLMTLRKQPPAAPGETIDVSTPS